MAEPALREIMRREVPTVALTDTVAKVARVLADSGLPGVPVVDNGVVVGIVTDKDIVQREANVSSPNGGAVSRPFLRRGCRSQAAGRT